MVEHMLNYYAEDEWEFWRVEKFSPQIFKSITAAVVGALFKIGDGDEQAVPIIIFRKECTPEYLAKLAEQDRVKVESATRDKIAAEEQERQRIAARQPAICPDCSGVIYMDTEACNHCNAWLGSGAKKKPIPA
jgi:hypothetical protein